VTQHAFELVFALDEMVSVGYKEHVTLQQIKTFTEMDSHEEKLQKIIMDSKVNEARDAARKKAEALEKQKAEARMAKGAGAGGKYAQGFGSGSMGSAGDGDSSSSRYSKPASSSASAAASPAPAAAASAGAGSDAGSYGKKAAKGMQLGKAKKTEDFVAAMSKEEKMQVAAPAPGGPLGPAPAAGAAAGAAGGQPRKPVHLSVDEKLVLHLHREGSVEKMEIRGELNLTINDPDCGRIRLVTNRALQGRDAGFQSRLPPKVDKKAWDTDGVLMLKESDKPFPVGGDNAFTVLRWRKVSNEESDVPVSVNVWPNAEGSRTVVQIELQAQRPGLKLENVYVTLPCPSKPEVSDGADGDTNFNVREKTLVWLVPEISEAKSSANIEFSVPDTPADSFFPVHVSFSSSTLYSGLAVDAVELVAGGAAVDYSQTLTLAAEEFEVH
jgi:hypothetical protein